MMKAISGIESFAVFLFFVVFKALEPFYPLIIFEQNGRISPKDFFPFEVGVEHFELVIFERTFVLSEILIINFFRMLDLAQFENIKNVHIDL